MRYLITACLILWATTGAAFEIEARTEFNTDNSTTTLNIISTTDTALFAPLINSFQQANPRISVIYTAASSSQINLAIVEEGAQFDIAISSAMDLQIKLANDGFASRYASDATALVSDWGQWRDSIFAFTQEPAEIVLNRAAFRNQEIPQTRAAMIELLRNEPNKFSGRIGTYDVRSSGLGYLFATQDSRTSETYWRLTELMGQLNAQLYCCSSDMIEDVSTGKIAIAYNVLGSYAAARDDLADKIIIIEPQDYATVMLRTALILKGTAEQQGAELFMDHLLSQAWTQTPESQQQNLRRIPLGPGLLVFLDRLKRQQFLKEWESAILQ
jgi:iron(III) transport system substrate-binding protein